jgi:hypothetical protein
VKLGACGNVTVTGDVTLKYARALIGDAPMFCGRRCSAEGAGGPLGCVVVNVAFTVVATLVAGIVTDPE